VIIINDKPGQLCNQLWSYAPFIANSLEYKNTFVTLYFEDNYHLFENLNRFENIRFGWFRIFKIDIWFRKVLLKFIRFIHPLVLKTIRINVDRANWRAEKWEDNLIYKKNNIVFLGAGSQRKNNSFLIKYHNEITQIFEPKKVYKQRVDSELRERLEKFKIIVGVHIRRGDYRDFLGGIYNFDDKTYVRVMESIKDQLKSIDQRAIFLLCSNEKIDLSSYSNLEVFQISEPNSISDLYALSSCNYIIGPPSTYSMWASYYGKVPLKFIKKPNELINLKDFSEIIAQDTFANGNLLTHESD